MSWQKLKITADKFCKYDYLLFLSDADLINRDYLRIADRILNKNRKTGMTGGQTELISDVKPPKWFENHKKYYSIGSVSEQSCDITNNNKSVH